MLTIELMVKLNNALITDNDALTISPTGSDEAPRITLMHAAYNALSE